MNELGWLPIQYDCCLTKRGNENMKIDMHTGRKPGEHKGGDHSNASTR